ncbi:sugar ABC transporter ATP-binding protein [Glaciimonas sp. Gout2]|uniref:sugar ABC transporter ATP-binding protein n=1 Tax=unclassified Glaciimonas TaxID=2644401 RepID=UPI002AB51F4D|nr:MULTISPECIES: sugar ABC transporter ATP-binding protein [unclassified Glaciimonas]MDY7548551.1 sugar ABC transporter ATP-binding protein [Glaciimonas sp. CA11.2]MEB0013738.1 sugar ABC transporter ATP-binding protein [Glaciimonas sp. Cout2]MEB0083343.1 sugar ABC transporter ATP-binding protein [Glaciimonas sp. Gout2]
MPLNAAPNTYPAPSDLARSDLTRSDLTSSDTPPVLTLSGICKRFHGVVALDDVGLTVRAGDVMALIGENGAGKSTLVKTLTGIYQADGGTIHLSGKLVSFANPQAAMHAGITAVHQETVMFDELTVAENIFIGRQPQHGFPPRINWAFIEAEAEKLFARLEVTLPVRARVKDLSVAQRHFVEIARALSQNARVVIMDEPTASLSQREIHELYRIIRQLRDAGTAVIFISHKFDEIFAVADRYTVLRDGHFVAAGALADIAEPELVALMVGREIHQVFPKVEVALGPTILEVENFCHPTEFNGVNFSVQQGEIVGFYGLVGAGRSEVMQALFGLTPEVTGTVKLHGKAITIHSTSDAIAHGIAYVPEDRQHQGAHLSLPIVHNITLPILSKIGFFLSGRRAKETAIARHFSEQLELKAGHFTQMVSELSGGNQQKVVLAKWLATDPKVIILDEPTKGIDIGSKAAVHTFISELVSKGLSVILVSSELPEVLGMADRIVVMHQGHIKKIFTRAQATPENVVATASGSAYSAEETVCAY